MEKTTNLKPTVIKLNSDKSTLYFDYTFNINLRIKYKIPSIKVKKVKNVECEQYVSDEKKIKQIK